MLLTGTLTVSSFSGLTVISTNETELIVIYVGSFLGWATAVCPDEEQLKKLGDNMSNATIIPYGTKYESLKSHELYVTTGSASDWYVHNYRFMSTL